LAPKTIRFYLWFLYNFLRFFDIDVERVKGKIRLPKKAKIRDDRGLRLSEIQRIILASKSPRMRTLLHLLAATGLRINEARLLKVDNIDFENRVLRVPGRITKSGRPREIPLTREVAEALKNYLKRREVDSEWLFPSKEDPSKPVNRYKLYRGLYRILRSIGLNKRDSSGKGYQIHFHSFRKWFKTTLERAGVNRLLIEKWMGHDLGVQGDYFTPSPDYIEEEWEKAEKALTIFGRREPEEELQLRDDVIKRLSEEVKKRDEVIKELSEKIERTSDLVEELEELREQVNRIGGLTIPLVLLIDALRKTGKIEFRGIPDEVVQLARELMERRPPIKEFTEEEAAEYIEMLNALDEAMVEKWRKYFGIKSNRSKKRLKRGAKIT
ncbi:hypothetical protein DRO21_05610, partial [archaeon]